MLRILLIFLTVSFVQYSVAQNDPRPEVSVSKAGVVIPGEVIVKFPKGFTPINNREFSLTDLGLQIDRQLSKPMNIWLFRFDDTETNIHQVVRNLNNLNINGLLAQGNTYVDLRETIPNDQLFGNQWQHPKIDSSEAWDITTGGKTASNHDIVVCIIESANVMNHPDLKGNHWVNTAEIPNNGIDDDGNGYVDDYNGWNVNSNSDNIGSGGHGSAVAGMIGAVGNNDLGVVGANWDVKMMVVAGHNDPFDQANIVEAYTYPLEQRILWNDTNGEEGALVVATNASWGFDFADPEDYPVWCAVYETLGEAGILNCGATTNSNMNVDAAGDMPTTCPSDYMVGVTATNSNDIVMAGWGTTHIDVAAPGIGIYSTTANSYSFTSGTSFASPFTAGVIGLMYSVPCASFMDVVMTDPQQAADIVKTALFDGVDQTTHLQSRVATGGRINANTSMNLLISEVCDIEMTDAGVYDFESPVDGELTSAEPITVRVRNYGEDPISNFDVAYTVNGGTAVVETVSETINSLEWTTYTFNETADLSGGGEFTITSYTDLDGDQVPDNDAYTVVIEGELSIGDVAIQDTELLVVNNGNNQFDAILNTNQELSGDVSLKVYNLLGQEIITATPKFNGGQYTYSLDMNAFNAGVYLIKTGTASQYAVKKFIVK